MSDIKNLLTNIKKKLLTFGKFLIESTPGNSKRKLVQYSVYLLIIVIVNIFVGKNIVNTRYPWYSNVSIFLLLNINIILMLVMLLVIFRNLAKLLSDAHSNIFGARLKYKLVIFSILTAVVPVVVFFLFAVIILNNSINKWFDNQVDSALVSSVVLTEDYQKTVSKDLFNRVFLISQTIKDKQIYKNGDVANNFFRDYVSRGMFDGVGVFNSYGIKIYGYETNGEGHLNALVNKHNKDILNSSKDYGYDFIDEEQVYWAGLPVAAQGAGGGEDKNIIFAYKITPNKIAKDISLIQDARNSYKESSFFSYPIKKAYIMMMILMAMLVMFAGIWGSIYFAGSITKPIEELTDAAVEISKGNLEVSLRETGRDEITYLIKTFNSMTKQLNINTRELHNKNSILSEMYSQISRDNMYIDAIFKNVDSAIILFSENINVIKANDKANVFIVQNKNEFKSKVFNVINSFKDVNQTEHFENIEMTIDKENRTYSLSLSKISADDEAQILVVLEDITQILNAQRIKAWQEVATRITHEIKNPLTPIKLMAERVKKRSQEIGEDNIKLIISESMDTIVNETDNLLQLVEEFNLFARLPKASKTFVDLGRLVDETILLYTKSYPNIKFSVEKSGDLSFNADKSQIKRVFQNLITNAIHAIAQNGEITIKMSGGGAGIKVIFKDNGTGIKEEDMFKIFEPYFTKRSGGTGLGLAIVKKIIEEEHNGKINVESKMGEGTTFNISFS